MSGGDLHGPDSELQSSDTFDDDDDGGTGICTGNVDECTLSLESHEAKLTASAGLTANQIKCNPLFERYDLPTWLHQKHHVQTTSSILMLKMY